MSAGSIFELQIGAFVSKAKGNVDDVVRRVSLDIFGRVIMKTPVDTGRLMGSWLSAVNAIPSGEPGTLDKSGSATIARVQMTTMSAKAGDILYLVSNVVYARSIEYGHSRVKAPAGMVRVTIAEWNSAVQKAVADLPK